MATNVNTAYSLRDVFEAFTYGHGNLSLPVYMANYMFDVLASLFPLFIMILMATSGYKMLKQGDIKRQIREQAVYMSVIILGVYFAISIPGIHKYNGKPTYLLIDAYASVLKQGEDLADALAYNVLFNAANGSNMYTPDNPPTDNKAILNGFFDYQNKIEQIMSTRLSPEQRAKALDKYRDRKINGHLALSSPLALSPFETLAYLNSFVLTKTHHISYYEKPLTQNDVIPSSKASRYKKSNKLILYGDPKTIGDVKSFNFNGKTSFVQMLNFSGSSKVKPVSKYLEDIVDAYIDIMNGLIINYKDYMKVMNFKGEDKEYAEDYLLTLKSIKASYQSVKSAIPLIYSNGVINVVKFEKYMEDYDKKIKYHNYLFNWHREAISRLLNGVSGKSGTGLVNIGKYINSVEQRYKKDKVDFTVEQLNYVVDNLVDTSIAFTGIANLSFVTVSTNVPDSPDKFIVMESLLPVVEMMDVISFPYTPNMTRPQIQQLIVNKLNKTLLNYKRWNEMKADKSFTAQFVANNTHSTKASKTLKELADGKLGNSKIAEREISWVDLGYYYTVLKNHYAQEILFNTYLAVEDLYEKAITADMNEIKERLKVAQDAKQYMKDNNDFEKMDTIRTTSVAVWGVIAGVKSLADSVKKIVEIDSKKGFIANAWKKLKGMVKLSIVGIKAVASVGFNVVLAYLIVSIIINVIFIMLPSFLWMLAVIAWFFRTAVMISLLPMNIFLVFFESKQQAVKSMMFNLLGQALVPVTMVIIFFIVMIFSLQLEYMLDRFIPLLNPALFGDMTQSVANNLSFVDTVVNFIMLFIKTFIILIINTQLYMQFFRADDYVSEVLGERISYGQTISGSEVMSKMKVGQHV